MDHTLVHGIGEEAALRPHEIVFGAVMAAMSGMAILAHTFGPVPMSFTVPFVVLPAAFMFVGLVLIRRRLYGRLHLFADRVLAGVIWSCAATFAYDGIRVIMRAVFHLSADPFQAMPIFGHLITKLPATDPVAITVGWIYHLWNGVSYGIIFALLRPQGGAVAGFVWAMILQGLMIADYPVLLQVRLDDPSWYAEGIVGHGVWGIVLGTGLRLRGQHA